MKAFARRSLAMAMTLFMVLSVCVVPAFADEVKPVTGVSLNKSTTKLDVGETETMEPKVSPSDATNKTVTWSSSDETVATVSAEGKITAVKAGETTITVTTVDGGKTADCKVTVEMNDNAVITKVEAPSEFTIPYGISESNAKTMLKEKVKVTVTYDQGEVEKYYSWVKVDGETFDSEEIGNTCKFVPKVTVPEGVELPVITTTVGKAKLASDTGHKVDTMTVLLGIEEDDLDLPKSVSLDLDNGETVSFGIGDYDGKKTVNGLFKDWVSQNAGSEVAYNDEKVGTYTFTAEWKGNSDLYDLKDLKLTVKVMDSDFRITGINYEGASLKEIAESISDMLKGMYGEGLEEIEFTDIDLEGGDLYIKDEDGNLTATDDETFDAETFENLYYMPNGNGEDSVIEYNAYTDEEDDLDGEITLEASSFMLVSVELTDKEYVNLNADDFEDAFLNMDKDYEILEYVTFKGTNSKSRGYLYTDYDEDDDDGDDVKSSTKCFYDDADVDDDDDVALDDIVYVPGSDMDGGTYYISFTARGKDEDGKTIKDKVGYLRIILTEEADIVITAGKEQEVEIDPDLFLEYIEDYDTSNKDLEIVSVAITNAPYQAKKGYLVTDGDKLSKSGVKNFYADEDDVDVEDKKYDLFDMYFLGGEKESVVNATFKVTYLREGSSTKRTAEGTIDFVTGAATAGNTMNGTLQAAKTMNFGANVTLENFIALGDNNNEYIVFTSLPVGGKLVYNWGKSNQEDVKVGTEYWLSAKSGKKLMSNVTFVPSYSSSKVQKTVTIGVKGYNEKDRATTGTINITINYAAYSSKFYDITTSTYADSVDFLANQGITTGMTATTFGPNNNVTRAQFVTFLWRAAGSPSVTGVTNKFTDVKSTGTYAYAYQAILWAVQNNITTGRTATTFAPAANVTHQELLTFLYRYDVNYLKHSSTASSYINYSDYSSVDSWAQIPVKWADYKGILSGYTIQPKVAGTRATVALWLHRMLTL